MPILICGLFLDLIITELSVISMFEQIPIRSVVTKWSGFNLTQNNFT